MNKEIEKKYYTVKETMVYLSLSDTQIHKLKDKGELPYCRVGGGRSIRFRKEDLDNFLVYVSGKER